ncbi:MAG: transcription elongation factor GreA [Candidatus Kapaibacteriales bacterium]
MATNLLSKERIKELEEKLNDLRTRGRREVAKKIADARSHGDLSENADYDAAKDEQGLLELEIAKISKTLANSEVISSNDYPDDKVYLLSKVKVRNKKNGMEATYKVVSPAEADFEQDKIANTSPLGKALMGKSIGEVAVLEMPNNKTEFEILDISK